MKTLSTITLLLLCAPSLQAQHATTDLRELYASVGRAGAPGALRPDTRGHLWIPPGSTQGSVPVLWREGTSEPVELLPMDRAGHLCALSETDFLVAGSRSSSGVEVGRLAHLRLDFEDPAIAVLGAVDVGAVDPLQVCHDPIADRLYLLDGLARRIVSAPWSGSGPLPAAGAFGTVVDHTEEALLARPGWVQLEAHPSGGLLVVASDGHRASRYSPDGQGWTVDRSSWRDELATPVILAESRFLPVNGPWELEIAGPASFPLTVTVRGEEGLLATADLAGPQSSLSITTGQETPGNFGHLVGDGMPAFDFRTCVRYGQPQNTAFYPLGRMYCDLLGPHEGRQDLVVWADVTPKADGSLLHSTPLIGALWVGLRDAAGNDPVAVDGESAILTPVASLPFSLPAGTLPRDLSFALPAIPAGSGGEVMLFQVVVSDGVNLAWSDVFGIETRDALPFQ